MSVELHLEGGRTAFKPGETASGTLAWDLPETPASLELRVFWRTEGKGTQDLELVRTVAVPGGGPTGERSFALPLPGFPYSYAGTLISIVWHLEAVALPSGASQAVPIVISPTGAPIAPAGTAP
jgi:hypothetical protein